jgi:branched-chain amino acid transport system permease protein
MPLSVYFFLEFSAIYILVGWGIYLSYRNGQICYTPFLTTIIGAYFTALATRDWGWPFGLALMAAIGIGALFAFASGVFLTRLGALPMLLATLGLIFIIQTTIRNLDFLGGVWGFWHIPPVEHLVPITYGSLTLIGFFIYRLDHSRIGRAMELAFVDRDLAATSGVNLFRLSVSLQVIGGAIGGLAGGLWAPLTGSLRVDSFGFFALLLIMCFMFVGGYSTMWGLVVFTPILYGLVVVLPQSIATWSNVIFGALLMVILSLRPEGVIDRALLRTCSIKSRAWLERVKGLRKSEASR